MVLIISRPLEPSTDKVIDWLLYYKIDFKRIDGKEIFSDKMHGSIELNKKGFNFRLKGKDIIEAGSITSVWYRRDSTSEISENNLTPISEEGYYKDIFLRLEKEYTYAKKGLYGTIQYSKKVLGSFKNSSPNKIEVLSAAIKYGIDVPQTIITSSKLELVDFIAKHGSVITKSIWESIGFSIKEEHKVLQFSNYTEVISFDKLNKIPDTFFCSLFQEQLDKDFEIRTFYLNGEFYSMAIFSQMDPQTSIDFRKYSNNRNVPYRLPKEIEEKIHFLMEHLGLNTGSLDIVKTRDGRLVFLEINPVGQYDMTSMPCNYNLDKKIANFLMQDEKHEKR